MRGATGLDGDARGREAFEERDHVPATQLPAQDGPFGGIDAVELEDVLGRVHANAANLFHERPDTVGEWVRRKVESGVGAVISGGFAMSLHPQQPIPSVPEQTARIARAAFPKGSPYLTLRDTLGTIFVDGHFADLYPQQGQPACPPWRLALITLMQFREGLSDRQAAEAV